MGAPQLTIGIRGLVQELTNSIFHIEGEGWCNNVTNCLGRKNTCLGSSKQMLKEIPFSGILSNRQSLNPVLHQKPSEFLHIRDCLLMFLYNFMRGFKCECAAAAGESITRSSVIEEPGDHGEAHLVALGELEFRKQFLILSDAGGS
ncbi:pectin acetylesterase 6-like [Rosa rugosa]|uniref:pectin acetylesterase 6-like n=1 Tax=Rosa rugosa TaxID=74645 RepID=UPI002B40CBC2|nr:pectin acetylesterase 6-like [Rosa rugosa]XP_062025551.1 pectin acetylesterase 6-like [Rosa rugosa]XP_062025552.1 pectin acetylesterase 6-like [Rosa rugosa]